MPLNISPYPGIQLLFLSLFYMTGLDAYAKPPAPTIPVLSSDQVTRLNAGEILVEVINGAIPIGDVLGVIDATPELVLESVLDFNHYTEFMPYMTQSEIVSQEGSTYHCSGVTDTPWPMDDRIWSIIASAGPTEVEGLQVLVSTWDYVPESGNIQDTEGYWLLIPWGETGQKTLVRYYLVADLGTWIPDVILNWATENMLPGIIEGLRMRIAP